MAVSKRLRYEVLRRDNHACRYCGGAAPDVTLTVDHVVPTALGGSDEPSNLVAACVDCNSGKSASSPDAAIVDDVKQDAIRWAAAMKAVMDERAAGREELEMFTDSLLEFWDSFTVRGKPIPRPPDAEQTLERFLLAGLTHHFVDRAIRIAMSAKKVQLDSVFRYMCGICWRELTDVQTAAAARLGQQASQPTSADWGVLVPPTDNMLWTIPPSPTATQDYGRLLADLTHPRVEYWIDTRDRVHRAGAHCWSRQHLSELAFRADQYPVPTTTGEVARWVELGHSWAFCGGCCMDLRERADA